MNRKLFSLVLSIGILTGLQFPIFASLALPEQEMAFPEQEETTETLKGHVLYEDTQDPEITELNFDQYIDVDAKKIELDSTYLSGNFWAYQVNLKNNTPYDLQIVKANIINGYEGDDAYELVRNAPFTIRRIRLSLNYVSLATSALKGAQRVIRNKTAKEESVLFPNEIPKQVLEDGQSIEFTALVPRGQTPKIFVKYYEPEQKKVYYSHVF